MTYLRENPRNDQASKRRLSLSLWWLDLYIHVTTSELLTNTTNIKKVIKINKQL